MISTSKALSIIKNNTNQIDNEKVEVEKAIDRVLTIDVKSTITSPPFNMSAMDGYAIKYKKISNLQKPFQVLSEIFAGDNNDVKINNQEAIRALLIAGTSRNMNISPAENKVIDNEFKQIDHSARTIQDFYKDWKQKREIKSDQTPVTVESLGQSNRSSVEQISSEKNS